MAAWGEPWIWQIRDHKGTWDEVQAKLAAKMGELVFRQQIIVGMSVTNHRLIERMTALHLDAAGAGGTAG